MGRGTELVRQDESSCEDCRGNSAEALQTMPATFGLFRFVNDSITFYHLYQLEIFFSLIFNRKCLHGYRNLHSVLLEDCSGLRDK